MNYINVAQIDEVTGEFLFFESAPENPQEPGTYLIPRGCIKELPDIQKIRQELKPIWNSKSYDYKEDYRGKTVYSTTEETTKTITELGPVPEGFTLLERKPFQKWNGKNWIEDTAAKTEFDKQVNNNQVKTDCQEIEFKSMRNARELILELFKDIADDENTPEALKRLRECENLIQEPRSRYIK